MTTGLREVSHYSQTGLGAGAPSFLWGPRKAGVWDAPAGSVLSTGTLQGRRPEEELPGRGDPSDGASPPRP